MSALPKQVRKQIAEANRIADEYYKRGSSVAPPAGEAPTGDSSPPPVGDSPTGDLPIGEPPTAGTKPTPPVVDPPTSLPTEGFEQKYKVLSSG